MINPPTTTLVLWLRGISGFYHCCYRRTAPEIYYPGRKRARRISYEPEQKGRIADDEDGLRNSIMWIFFLIVFRFKKIV